MLKKLLIVFVVVLITGGIAFTIFSRQAPAMLVRVIEKSLGKKILIRSIDYHFPDTFELSGFEIQEVRDFAGQTSFSVDNIQLDISPLSLLRKRLIINAVNVENADIVIRKFHGKLTHALSDAVNKPETGPAGKTTRSASVSGAPTLPLEIRQFRLSHSHFKFIDYDVQEGGFVIALNEIDATIDNIALPFSDDKTFYKISARLPQGHDPRTAEVKISGRTQFKTMDTDANIIAQGISLPYFEPYYRQVTQAAIGSAYLDSRISLLIERNDLRLNADLEISQLVFRAYESENQIFGLHVDELLSFLRDRSGRLKLQIDARWNIADRSMKARDIIRKSIERSLKKTMIGNVGNILENALQKISEQGTKINGDNLEEKIKKLKGLFKT
ncbi:MAG: hypothetical protein AUJ71_01785 [Candidatus Omnitrophica bacterium CG1_02_49_16]|nr:MAG: hypothetical protein AUJ71_01785 [Candidatus Omnitrophica bacterium CG1_02_49_16]